MIWCCFVILKYFVIPQLRSGEIGLYREIGNRKIQLYKIQKPTPRAQPQHKERQVAVSLVGFSRKKLTHLQQVTAYKISTPKTPSYIDSIYCSAIGLFYRPKFIVIASSFEINLKNSYIKRYVPESILLYLHLNYFTFLLLVDNIAVYHIVLCYIVLYQYHNYHLFL